VAGQAPAGHNGDERGAAPSDRIVKVNIVLADIDDYDEMNCVWRELFPVDPPARTTCGLPMSNRNGVEIECTALSAQNVAECC